MKELVADGLRIATKLAFELLGHEQTKAILEAEYLAADAIADEAERKKLESP